MLRFVPVVLLLVTALAGSSLQAADLPYVQHQNIVYGEVHGVGLLMDVFVPTGKPNGLGIVDVASGAWYSDRGKINDHKKGQFYDIFGKRGYTVFAIRPGSQTRFSVADMLDNLNLGIRWVKQHAAEYKIDPDRLGLTGASAGGHLACLASVTAQDAEGKKPGTTVKATAVFFPPTDFLQYGGRPFDPQSYLFKCLALSRDMKDLKIISDDEMKKRLTQISPARRITEKATPFLFIHGNADLMVPLQQSETMVEALKKANIPAELIVKQGGGHPWPTIHEEVAIIADWFDKHLPPELPTTPASTQVPAAGN